MSEVRAVMPFAAPVDATIIVPGSKSISNRAIVCAALATGVSTLSGMLRSDDTNAMSTCLRMLGVEVDQSDDGTTVEVEGNGASFPRRKANLECRMSGTTARFIAPLAALGTGDYTIDADFSMRRRPMGDLFAALRSIGAILRETGEGGKLPVVMQAHGLRGGAIELPGNVSSQFLSGLLLSAPLMAEGLDVRITTELVSRSYVDLTTSTMSAFGVATTEPEPNRFVVAPQAYQPAKFAVEPDASAASYFFALAAITGGRVTVPNLGRGSRQGDIAFVHVLERMGCRVEIGDDSITVYGTAELHGVDVDMTDCSDVAQTLASVAVFADGPTRVTGIGFIRGKETDRIGAVVTELCRAGIDAAEEADGFTITPGPVQPATIATYDDHRMAMSFALLGTRSPGIGITDPGCVAKTFPTFWDVLDAARVPS
jgi:3-phosphoshikimate 1-carboxyvinyltransferase